MLGAEAHDLSSRLGLDYLPPDQRHYKLYKDKLDHVCPNRIGATSQS